EVVVFAADEMNRSVGLKILNVSDVLGVNPYDAIVCVCDSDPPHLASRASAKKNTRDENRTRKAIGRGILSPVRLPVPPPGRNAQSSLNLVSWSRCDEKTTVSSSIPIARAASPFHPSARHSVQRAPALACGTAAPARCTAHAVLGS